MARRIVRKLAISVGSLVVVLGAAEFVCRAAGVGPKPGSFRWVGNEWVGYLPMPDQHTSLGRPDPVTGTSPKTIRINNHGQRGADHPLEKADGEWRVAVVGDSLTMGEGVNDEECFPARLEQLLRAEDPPGVQTRVLNAGVNGWHTWNYAQWAVYLMPEFAPDLLVVGLYLGNDMVPPAEGAGVIPIPLHSLLRNSALYHWMLTNYRQVLWKRMEAGRRGKSLTELELQLEQYKGVSELDLSETEKHMLWEKNALPQLMRIRDAARLQGVSLVVLLLPSWGMIHGGAGDAEHEFLRQKLEEAGVQVATCLAEVRALGRQGWLDGDAGHLSPAGNQVVAEQLARQLRSL